jgi:AraC family transcriptional regulator
MLREANASSLEARGSHPPKTMRIAYEVGCMKHFPSLANTSSEACTRFESRCHALERIAEMTTPSDDSLTVLVVMGSCSVQRNVHGQWADLVKVVDGAVMITESSMTTRIIGTTMPEGMALCISKAAAKSHLNHLRDHLHACTPIQIPLDPVIVSLTKVLMAATRHEAGSLVEKNVIDILLTRLGQVTNDAGHADVCERVTLPNWRLRRVVKYVDEQLDESISLADMAAVAGLSPMHFAAQFKLATGMRPHHYLIARRIQRAKHLLDGTQHTVLDVALAVGFRTQAHFTTVFKQRESVTPARWRKARLAA